MLKPKLSEQSLLLPPAIVMFHPPKHPPHSLLVLAAMLTQLKIPGSNTVIVIIFLYILSTPSFPLPLAYTSDSKQLWEGSSHHLFFTCLCN